MGNSYSTKKCKECDLSIGDYGLDYICHITGKGKWHNLYICPNCLYERVHVNKIKKDNYNLKVDYNDDIIKSKIN
tara:strand:- start:6894 stop:7118 length:225 start_codon:yes stop_codon:yes gene_type:complete